MSTSPIAAFETKAIDAIFAPLDQCHLPGATVGIAIDGRPVYRKGFGLANMELPLALTPSTRIRIASITKHFVCLAYWLLCEEGKARVDDPIGKHLPDLEPASRIPTVLQLMGHTSGLRDGCDWFLYDPRGRVPAREILAFYSRVSDVNAPPGTAWCYNDGAYVLIGSAIERIAGQPLEEFLRERVFEPIGMHDTMLCRWDTAFVSSAAALHMTSANGRFTKSYRFNEGAGQGGIISTTDDMLRWLAHMSAPVVGSADTWHLMKAPQKLANGVLTGYGCGLMNGQYRGFATVGHSGMVLGAKFQMLKVPAVGLDIIVMTNRHDVAGGALVDQILETCLGAATEKKPMAPPLICGVYRTRSKGLVVQFFERQGQQIVVVDGVELVFDRVDDRELRPASASSFRKQKVLLRESQNGAAPVRFDDFGYSDDLIALEPPTQAPIGAITGRYHSDSSGIEAIITSTESGPPRLSVEGPFGRTGYALECLADFIWSAKSTGTLVLGGVMSFAEDFDGFRLSTGATKVLPFRRLQ